MENGDSAERKVRARKQRLFGDRFRSRDRAATSRSRSRVCVNTRAGVYAFGEKAANGRFFAIQFDRRFRKSVDICNRSVKRIIAILERNVKRRACFRERIPFSRSPWKNICFVRLTTMRVGCNRRFLTYIRRRARR